MRKQIFTGLWLFLLALPAQATPDYAILFIGNSHSSANDLPGLVTTLIETGLPDQQANAALAPGWGFLADRIDDGVTGQSLEARNWTHVILQAQKYSSSGLYFYPTDAAEEWIRRVRARSAEPVLFPEWPRQGNREEGPRVHALHLSIADNEAACVAPIGLAWEASIAANPGIVLHAPDGNHSNQAGALLTAYVLYEVITGQVAEELPNIRGTGVSNTHQEALRVAASSTVREQAGTCPEVQGAVAGLTGHKGIPTVNTWGMLILGFLVSAIGIMAAGKFFRS